MEALVGFLIALSVGMTGIGAGSFTTPALVLLFGMSGADAVGTALVFSFILRIAVAPFYAFGKRIHLRYLRLMLTGAVPGLLLGVWFLRTIDPRQWNPLVLVVIGSMLVISAALTSFRRGIPHLAVFSHPSWLPWISLPIGFETGFSAAGAGALGSMVLLHCPEISASEVVGTDIGLGLVLAGLGAGFHFTAGTVSSAALKPLLLGAAPGVLLGCYLSRKIPSRLLQRIMLLAIVLLGLQLLWIGARDFADYGKTKSTARSCVRRQALLPAARRGARHELNPFDPPQASGVSFRSIQVHQFSINPLSPNMAMAMCTCCCMCPGGRPVMRNLS